MRYTKGEIDDPEIHRQVAKARKLAEPKPKLPPPPAGMVSELESAAQQIPLPPPERETPWWVLGTVGVVSVGVLVTLVVWFRVYRAGTGS